MESALDIAYFALGAGLYSKNDVKIKNNILNKLCKLGAHFIQDDRIQFQSKELLMDLLKRDDLQVENEARVLDAVMRWGRQQCKTAGIDETCHANVVSYMDCFLPFIRLPTDMSAKFWIYPPFSNRGFEEHVQKIATEFNLLKKYNNIARKGQDLGMFVFKRTKDGPQTLTRLKEQVANWLPSSAFTLIAVETIIVLANGPYVFRGITMVKGIFGEDFEKNEYNYEQVEIIVPDGDETKRNMKKHEGVIKVEDNKLSFTFNKPRDFEALKSFVLKVIVMGSLVQINKATRVSKVLTISKDNMWIANGMKSQMGIVKTTGMPNLKIVMQLPIQCAIKFPSNEQNEVPFNNGIIDEIIMSLFKRRDEI